MVIDSEPQPESSLQQQRDQVLHELVHLVVHRRALRELFREMVQGLQKVASLDSVHLSLHDSTFDTMRLHLWEGGDTPAVPAVEAVVDTASGWVWQNQQPLHVPDLRQKTRFFGTFDRLREGTVIRVCSLASPLGQEIIGTEATVPLHEGPVGLAMLDKETKFFKGSDLAAMDSPLARRLVQAGVQSLCCIPLNSSQGVLGVLNLGSTREQSVNPNDLSVLTQIANQLAVFFQNARAYQELNELKNKLKQEKLYLEDEIRSELNFEEIIGDD